MNRTSMFVVFSSLWMAPAITVGQQGQTPSSQIPTTISEEARQFLAKGSPLSRTDPQTVEQWQEARAKREVLGKSLYEASRHKFAGPADILALKNDQGPVVQVHKLTPVNVNAQHADKAILHVHGGGYCFMSPESTYCVCAPLANLTGLRVYCVDYRLAPEHPYPAALDDCVTAYKGVIKLVRPENLAILGESAGASLSLTMLLRARDEHLPMPAALLCISPCVDLTMSGDSIHTLEGLDPVLSPHLMRRFLDAYAGTADRGQPLVSPLFADYTAAFPPTIIQTGTRDLLLSDCVRLHQQLKTSGVDAELSVREGMWHGYHIIPNDEFPEAKAGFQELADFCIRKLQLGRR